MCPPTPDAYERTSAITPLVFNNRAAELEIKKPSADGCFLNESEFEFLPNQDAFSLRKAASFASLYRNREMPTKNRLASVPGLTAMSAFEMW